MPPTSRTILIPQHQQLEYNALFENLHRMINEVDAKLPHYAVFMKEEVIRKLVLMVSRLHSLAMCPKIYPTGSDQRRSAAARAAIG